jgi:hypothetical protein
MRTLRVPDAELELMLAQWLNDQGKPPQWRVPRCWGCGRHLWLRMWHVFWRDGEREAHLCRRCGKPYEVEVIEL